MTSQVMRPPPRCTSKRIPASVVCLRQKKGNHQGSASRNSRRVGLLLVFKLLLFVLGFGAGRFRRDGLRGRDRAHPLARDGPHFLLHVETAFLHTLQYNSRHVHGGGLCLAALLADPPVEKARELLEKAATTAGAAQPEMHAVTMMYLGGAWRKLDKKQAVAYLRQAFTAAAALPEGDGPPKLQAEVIKAAARMDLQEACDLLRAMNASEARNAAADSVVDALIGERDFDKAVEVLALTPGNAAYPFGAALRLFEALPKDDSRRVIVFGNAASAYRRSPGDGFRTFLAKHWKEVPREMAQAALAPVVNAIRDRDDEPGAGESLETPKGTLKLGSRKSMELFDLLPVLRALDPARAKEVLAQHADLRAAAQLYPEGRQSIDMSGVLRSEQRKDGAGSSFQESDFGAMPPLSLFAGNDLAKMQDSVRVFTAAAKKASEAWAVFEKDRSRALSLADDVAVPAVRADLLLRFAGKMPELLPKCASVIAEMPYAGDRIMPLLSVAELEHKRKNEKAAWDALESAMAGIAEVYRSDTDADLPNRAPRVFWPSTLGCRRVVWQAAKLFGARTEALFAELPADLLMLAQIELAGTLLGGSDFDAEHGSFSFQVVH